MPNIKSMKKDLKRNEKSRVRNQASKSALKTFVKKAKGTGAVEDVKTAVKNLDKAAQRGIIHKNQAARRKSRLMKAAAAKAKS
jgi:small subunit ribosomal protein S20